MSAAGVGGVTSEIIRIAQSWHLRLSSPPDTVWKVTSHCTTGVM